jgi:hypothetical protein
VGVFLGLRALGVKIMIPNSQKNKARFRVEKAGLKQQINTSPMFLKLGITHGITNASDVIPQE